MRPIDFCYPTLCQRVPVHACSRFIVGICTPRAPDGLRPSGPRNRAFHDARVASASRPAAWGLFVPHEARIRFRFVAATDLWYPCRLPRSLRARCLPQRDSAKAAKVASTPSAVTRSKLSRSEVPSLGKNPRLRTTISGRRSRIIVGPATLHVALPTIGFSSPTTSPGAFAGAARLPLVKDRDARVARLLSREDCHPWARSPSAVSPC